MFEEEEKVYRLFISHVNRDDEEHDLFLSKLDASHEFQWEDIAVQGKVSPEDITEQVESADVVIILSGLISRDWNLLTRMIDSATKLEKPVVVVRPYGMENVPANLEEIASDVVGWNTPCIVEAIVESYLGDNSN